MTTVLVLIAIAAIGVAAGYRELVRVRRGHRRSVTYTGNAWSDGGGGGSCGDGGGGGGDC